MVTAGVKVKKRSIWLKPLSTLTKCELYRIVCFNSVNICHTESYNLSLEISYDASLGNHIFRSILPQAIEQKLKKI